MQHAAQSSTVQRRIDIDQPTECRPSRNRHSEGFPFLHRTRKRRYNITCMILRMRVVFWKSYSRLKWIWPTFSVGSELSMYMSTSDMERFCQNAICKRSKHKKTFRRTSYYKQLRITIQYTMNSMLYKTIVRNTIIIKSSWRPLLVARVVVPPLLMTFLRNLYFGTTQRWMMENAQRLTSIHQKRREWSIKLYNLSS